MAVYKGKVNGNSVELREPNLEDIITLEETLLEEGSSLDRVGSMPQSKLALILFRLLCVKFGDEKGIDADTLKTLPLKAFSEVAEAVAFFRDDLGL